MSIYVGNLSYEVEEDDLKQIFSEYGSVKRVRLPMNRETGERRGFACLAWLCSFCSFRTGTKVIKEKRHN